MRYAIARVNREAQSEAYRIYVTDALKVLGGLNARYADLIGPAETRTAEEVIDNVKTKLRSMGGE